MSKTADVRKKADALEPKLKGKLFIGGDVPSAEDCKAFDDLLGAKNTNMFRWVKHIASFTDAERAAWGAAGKKLAVAEAPKEEAKKEEPKKAAAPAPKAAAADDDDDIDLFGEETEEDRQALADKKKADAEKAAAKKKAAPIAKSSILLDIKAWDDTVDLEGLATKLKSNVVDGLTWGAHKLEPVAFGVKKLRLLFVIEDEKVSSEDIEDLVNQYEEEVQSQDIVAWNKV